MKKIIVIITAFLTLSCDGQFQKENDNFLAVSPAIDRSDSTNQSIIKTLIAFLKTKNSSLSENSNWLKADFQRFTYPYFDIYDVEKSKHGKNFYKPALMELIRTDNSNQKIVKLAFIGHNSETEENSLKSIYNLVANVNHDGIKFSKYLDYATRDWTNTIYGSLTYKITPNKNINKGEIDKQLEDIEKICNFFKVNPIPITYYSCVNPKEVFEIKGFDYHPMMYVDKTGGLTEFGNIIFSGNNSEIYTHEIVHIYTNNLFPKIDKFIDEGLATYIAGSGNYDYNWHRKKFDKFLNENPDFDFIKHMKPFERYYYEEETSIPYVSSALILERTKRIYGKAQLIEILKSEKELWETLRSVGLTKENLNKELRKEVKLPATVFD